MPTDDRPAGRGPWCCRLAAVAVLAAAGWAASRNASESALRETAPDRVPVEAVVRDRAACWNEGNLDGFLSYYWNDDELTVYAGGTATTGWQAVSDRYRRTYKDGHAEMGRQALTDLVVRYTGPGSAVARGRWELTASKGSAGGLFTLWLRRIGGKWVVVHEHTTAAEL